MASLYFKHLENPTAPIRLKNALDDKDKLKNGTEFPYRSEYEFEFDAIWEKQREFYPKQLNAENKEKIRKILFSQRALKEPEIGFCYFEAEERRIPKAHPLFQEFRIRQFINNLKIDDDPLTLPQKEKLFETLMNPTSDSEKNISYEKIKEILQIDEGNLINYEETNDDLENGKGVPLNKTELAIKKLQQTKENALYIEELQMFWTGLNLQKKCEIISFLDRPKDFFESKKLIDLKKSYEKARTVKEQDTLIIEYLHNTYNLNNNTAQILLYTSFEEGYGSLSEKAIMKILPYMKNEGLQYDEACKKAGYNHSQYIYEERNELPYYGEILKQHCLGAKEKPKSDEERFGKIGNATVHVALNQIRYLVNELILIYGKPSDVSIEYARDLNASAEDRRKMLGIHNKNMREKKRIQKDIEDKCNIKPSKNDKEKYKIWESMGKPNERICPYTGKQISITNLFDGSTEIDHILPYSRTLDNTFNNKIICFAKANKDKGNRTPYEAFGPENNDSSYSWSDILKHIKGLNKERRWRFSKDAMYNGMGTPISRLLNDTRYMTKILQQYLLPIVDPNGCKTVQAIPGELTAKIRKVWGLNDYKEKSNVKEYRVEHYHHAIDAVVIAAVNRAQINNISRELNREALNTKEETNQIFKEELWKLRPENKEKTTDEDIADLKKRIKDFKIGKTQELIKRLVKKPDNLDVKAVKDFISKINISHKVSLKNIQDRRSTVGELHEEEAYGLRLPSQGLKGQFQRTENGKQDSKTIDITTYVPIFRNKTDRDAYFDAYREWFIAKGKSKLVRAKSKEEKLLQDSLKNIEICAEQKLRDFAKRAFKWFVSGNIYCMTIYEINQNNKIKGMSSKNRGKWEGEIVSNYNATLRVRRGESVSYLPYRWPTSKKVMELHRNDMVLATFKREEINALPDDDRVFDENGAVIDKGTEISTFAPGLRSYLKRNLANAPEHQSEIKILFRVKSIAVSCGKISFIPHDIAKELSGNDTSWGTKRVSNLRDHNVRKVYISPAGKMKYA